jgi:hypothetical protein
LWVQKKSDQTNVRPDYKSSSGYYASDTPKGFLAFIVSLMKKICCCLCLIVQILFAVDSIRYVSADQQ